MIKNMFKTFYKDDPLQVSLQKNLLFEDNAFTLNKGGIMNIYRQQSQIKKQDELVKLLINKLQKKKQMLCKLKIIIFLFLISKQSQYDICDMLMVKKIKILSEQSLKKKINHSFQLADSNKQQYIHKFLLIPIYNYMIKLAANQELYTICKKQQIPSDQIFRKGSRIRFIWIFKIYNLINLLIPIITPLIILLEKNIQNCLYSEILTLILDDIAIYTNFITKSIEQTLGVANLMLMPYSECLQFFESLKEYNLLKQRLEKLMGVIKKYVKLSNIRLIQIAQQTYRQIEMLAMRVQLISSSLRNNNPKQNQRLMTEYNQKVQVYEMRLKTQGDENGPM